MSAHPSLVTLVAVVITAILLISQILLGSPLALAGDTWQTRVERSPPGAGAIAPVDQLDARDEVAALERIQYALSEVGDGSTYVWKRWHGRLSGIDTPDRLVQGRLGPSLPPSHGADDDRQALQQDGRHCLPAWQAAAGGSKAERGRPILSA